VLSTSKHPLACAGKFHSITQEIKKHLAQVPLIALHMAGEIRGGMQTKAYCFFSSLDSENPFNAL
jgi:hypothetical protein